MKKAFLCLLALAIVFLASCSRNEEKGGAETIVIWHDKEDGVIEVLEEALDKIKDEVTVVFEKKASLTEALKLVGNDPKAAPDMYFFAHDKIGVYAEMGIIAPITDFISEEEFSSFLPITLDAGLYKGKRYQLPLYYETLLFIYNKKYMKESDIPSTTEELYAYMEKKTKYGHYGFVEQHSTPYYAAGWLHAFGTDWIDGDGNPLLDDPRTTRALEYHRKFVALMPGETEYATVNTLFSEGMAHSTIAGPWFIPTVVKKGIDVGFAPMPLVEETGERINPYCGVQGLHVLKTAESKKGAVTKVLGTLMDEEIQIKLALGTGCAPAGKECYSDPRIQGDALVNAMRETAESAVPMSNRPEMDVMFTVSSSLLTDVNMSGKDIESSAKSAQKKALELLEAMK